MRTHLCSEDICDVGIYITDSNNSPAYWVWAGIEVLSLYLFLEKIYMLEEVLLSFKSTLLFTEYRR
jgi:hypothetical protein